MQRIMLNEIMSCTVSFLNRDSISELSPSEYDAGDYLLNSLKVGRRLVAFQMHERG